MDSVKSPSSLRIERGPACLIVRLTRADADTGIVEQLVDALDSHCVNRLVVETVHFSDQLIDQLNSLRDQIATRGGSVKLVHRPEKTPPAPKGLKNRIKSQIPVFGNLEAALLSHRFETR
jgi:hypothetical protein